MTPKAMRVLEQCIETGVELGWARAHKHVEDPDELSIKERIADCVMMEIIEWFDFGGPHETV